MGWLACLQCTPVAPIELWGPVRGRNVSVSLHPSCCSGYSIHRSRWHCRMAAVAQSCPERRPRGLAGLSAACWSQFPPTSLGQTHVKDSLGCLSAQNRGSTYCFVLTPGIFLMWSFRVLNKRWESVYFLQCLPCTYFWEPFS